MLSKNERITAIKNEIENKGMLTLCKSQLAKKYGVSRTTIHNDFKEAILDIDPESITMSKAIVDDSFKRSLLVLNKIINKNEEDYRLILQSIEIQRRVLESYSNFLVLLENKSSMESGVESNLKFLQEVAEMCDWERENES